jgi:hypothetical protein
MEAARQFTHGNLHPHWAYTAAYNAGEPRFVFYPPLSWELGALLGLLFPWVWTPIAYIWLALTAAGFALYRLARDFASPIAALVAATLYAVNPYMLFTAYERSAYAELLAAAWIPLLLQAILREQVTIPRIAIPIALLWLTNAPAAVMSCYALALLTAIRLAIAYTSRRSTAASNDESAPNPGAPYIAVSSRYVGIVQSATAPAHRNSGNTPSQTPLQLALNTTAGTALGLGLAAFYILPAAYERRFVQIAMAIIPNMRIQDNFLFHRTGDAAHDQVLHTASLIALAMIVATAILLLALFLSNKARVPHLLQTHREGWDVQMPPDIVLPLTVLTLTITLLLTPLTTAIWAHAPELGFLQFPWRLAAILAAILAFALALALSPLKLKTISTAALTLIVAVAFTYPAYHLFHQSCDEEDTIAARLALFQSNRGAEPTDEYTPANADNDSLAPTDPPYWLSPDPNAKAPAKTGPAPTSTHLNLNSPTPEDLILNLRDYPAWRITRNGTLVTDHLRRDDGLIAFPIPAGPSTIDIHYAQTLDQTLGDVLSLISLALLALLLTGRKKKII